MFTVWVIYYSPSDFPGRWVVRPQTVRRGGVIDISPRCWVVGSLAEARGRVPRGLVCQHRRTDDDPDFKQWAAQVSRGLIPKLAESAASVALISPGSVTDVDVKHAVEIGFILLMGRPLILAVEPGVKVPAGLARAADRIVEYNPDEPERGNQRLQAAFDDLTGD